MTIKKAPKKDVASKKIEQLEVEVSLLRDAYFQLKKVLSERKQAEQKVRESEEKFRLLFQSANDITLFVSKYGEILDVNQRIEDILGFKRDEVIGKNFTKLGIVTRKNLPRMLRLFKDSIMGKKTISVLEVELKHKNGKMLHIEASTRVVKRNGEIIGTMNILKDITERKQAEEEIRKSEEKYRKLFESASDMIQNVRPDGTLADVNPTWCRVLGYTKKEALNMNLMDIIHPRSQEHCMAVFKKVISGEPAEGIEAEFVTKKGKVIFVNGNASCIFKDGKPSVTWGVFRDITERKQAEEELQRSKAFTENVLTSVKDGLSVLDTQGVHIIVNDSFCRITGFKREELIGVGPPHPYWPEEEYENIEQTFQEVLKKGKFKEIELVFKRKNGERFPIILSPSSVKDAQGKIINYIATIKDITERKKMEETLKERMKELTVIYETSRIMEESTDLNKALNKVVKIIPAAYQFPELTCVRMIYNGEEYQTTNFKETAWKQAATIKQGEKEIGVMEVFYLEEKPFLIEEEKMLKEVVSQIGSISGRKKVGAEVLKSKRSLAEAQRIVHLGNWDWDVKKNELSWSDEIYRIFGLEPQEFGATYEAFSKAIHPDDREAVKKTVDEALYEGKPYSIEHRIVLPDGSVRLVHEEAEVFRDKAGEPIRLLGTVQDVTERRQMERVLRKKTTELEKAKVGLEEKVEERTKQLEGAHKKALALKDEFVFIASHELKAPVTAISGFLEFAQEEVKTPKAKEALSDLDRANQRLLKLVQDLLEVARAEAGRIEIKTSSINITTPTTDVIENLKPLADKKGLKITRSGEKLPKVLADPERVSEVLTNLISNAIKYTEKGTIAISHEVKDTTMITSISDTGVGMGKEDLSHLFEKFWRSKEVKQAEGTGLGLFIVKQLVEKMGGKIWAESQKGKGTTFSFSLPLATQKGIIKKG